MRPDIESLLQAALDTREVGIVIRNVCAVHGEVLSTGVVCSLKNRTATEITGLVEMKEQIALQVARQLQAGNVGSRLVIFRYRAPKGLQVREVRTERRVSAASRLLFLRSR